MAGQLRLGFLWRLQGVQLLPGPVRQQFLLQHPQEVRPVPPGFLSVAQAGTADGAPDGVGAAAESVVGIPELVFRRPAGLPQRVRAEDQHLAGVIQFLKGIGQAVSGGEQPQCLIGIPVLCHKAIQHFRVGCNHKVEIVLFISGNVGFLCPSPVGWPESAVVIELLDRIGQHPANPLETELLQNAVNAVIGEVGAVKALPDGCLNGLLAGEVRVIAGSPQSYLVGSPGIFQGVPISSCSGISL